MEKITLTLSVSLGMASKILAILREDEDPQAWESLDDFDEVLTHDEPEVAPKATPKEPPKAVEPVSRVTIDELRHAFAELSDTKGKDAAKRALASLGYVKVTQIPESDYVKALSTVKGAM